MATSAWTIEGELERLLSRSPGMESPEADVPIPPVPQTAANDAPDKTVGPLVGESRVSPDDVDYLLRQAEQAVRSMQSPPADALPKGIVSFRLDEVAAGEITADAANLDLIRDLEMNLKIELGRTQMNLEDVLKLRKGLVVALDRLAGDPVDIYANGRLIARGEVLVMDDNFCVRVLELAATEEAC